MRDGTWLALISTAGLAAAGGLRRGSRNENGLTKPQAEQMVRQAAKLYAPTYAAQMSRPWPVADLIEQKLWENALDPRAPFFGPGAELDPADLEDAIEVIGSKRALEVFRRALRAYEQGGDKATK